MTVPYESGSAACSPATVDLRPWFARDSAAACRASSIEPFLQHGAAVDPLGLATVLAFGYALGARTVLSGISVDVIDAACFAARTAPTDGELADLVVEAVRRSVGSESPIVLLSGGRDSRLILMAMHRLGIQPRRVLTLDQRGRDSDAAIAQRVAASIGHSVERVSPLAFDAALELERHRLQSFQSLEHEWFVAIARRVRALGGRVTDGIGAGVLSTGSLLDPAAVALWRQGRLDELGEWTQAHGGSVSGAFLAAARSEGIPLASREEVLHEFVRVARSLEATPNPLGMYSLLHWTRRGIGASAYGLLPNEAVATPLYDTELCRAVAALPMDRAMATDWRETALRTLDRSGVPFSTREGGLLPRWLRHPIRTARSRAGRTEFVRALPTPLARLASVADSQAGLRRSFDRAAVGLLASLDRATGFLSGGQASR